MKLLDLVVKEFITIVEFLAQTQPVEKNRIVIERELFRKLLEKYGFMKFNQKTKVYKTLNFVIHDKNNYTMPYKDTVSKKAVRKVIINYEAYTTIKHLYETDANL